MFFKENIIESLPTDILKESTFDVEFLLSSSRVSRSWHQLFNNPSIWMHRLSKDFGIEVQMFDQLSNEAKKNPLFYKELYRSLSCFPKRNLPTFLESFINNKTKENLLLLARLNNIDEFANIPCDEQYMIMLLLIYMNRKIPDQFLKDRDEKLLQSLLRHSAKAGNLQMVKYLLDSTNKFGLELNRDTFEFAVSSGNLPLVQFLLDPENGFKLLANAYTLNDAAWSGNLQLLKFLLDPTNKFGLELNSNTTFDSAISSGNLQLVQFLWDPNNGFKLFTHAHTLGRAALSGNLQLVQYLLDPKHECRLTPNQKTLDNAAWSGNLQLVQYLLDPKHECRLTPNQNTLDNAAQSGNLQLVQYLLDPKHECRLTPSQNTLDNAAGSGNLQLLKFLLNPANQSRLTPDQHTLNWAVSSGDLSLVKFLLNPANRFGLTVDRNKLGTDASLNFELSEHLLPSHLVIQEGLQKLQEGDLDSGKALLQKASTICHSHFNFMLENILNNIEKSGLNDTAIQCLKSMVNSEEHVSGEFLSL